MAEINEPLSTTMQVPRDDQDIDLNPVTGELNLITDFNTGRILTSEYIHTGSIRTVYDPMSGTHIRDNPMVVVSNAGMVLKV